MLTKLDRPLVARLLYVSLMVQFIGAILVIRPSGLQWVLCLVTLGAGLGLFAYIARLRHRSLVQQANQPFFYYPNDHIVTLYSA